jgi:tRNA-dihydrouridine synthase B
VDINFGCSVRKIVKNGAGVALMKVPKEAEALIKAVRKAVQIPLTIKIRSGWDPLGDAAIEIAEIAEACGVDAIAIHPRTATQGFNGQADWSIIGAIKKRVMIPVIGNGDIFSADDALSMLQQTGCDAVMIGRKAIGNPWIFTQVLARINGEEVAEVDLPHRFKIMMRYLHNSVEYFGEEIACRMMRSRLCWFVKGLHNSSRFRRSINHIETEQEAIELIQDFREKCFQNPL